MPKNIGPMIAASAQLGVGYATRLLTDIPDEKFAAFACNADGSIESNHPAFICGHLSLYAPGILTDLGQSSTTVQVPDSYETLFSKSATCQNDSERKVYPPANELGKCLIESYTAVAEALSQTDDEVFLAKNPNEAMSKKFPTQGAMHAFYVGGHFMLHMGQLSAWRRAIGLGPA